MHLPAVSEWKRHPWHSSAQHLAACRAAEAAGRCEKSSCPLPGRLSVITVLVGVGCEPNHSLKWRKLHLLPLAVGPNRAGAGK